MASLVQIALTILLFLFPARIQSQLLQGGCDAACFSGGSPPVGVPITCSPAIPFSTVLVNPAEAEICNCGGPE